MRRRFVLVLLSFFALAVAAPAAHADIIEQVNATANGVLPASVTVTLSEPNATPGAPLVKVCIKSRTAGQIGCIAI
jgi:hypothetical protein